MVLEDVESDNECQQKCQAGPKVAAAALLPPPSQTANTPQEATEQKLTAAAPEKNTPSSQEDAETQTGRWTPFIQSIRKEAEDGALATMEER